MKTIRLRLDKILDGRNSNRSILSKQAGVNYPVVDRYYRNQVTQYDSKILLKFCIALNCDIKDLLEIVEE